MHYDQDIVKTITPGGYLDLYDRYPVITPSMSSWGWKGYSEVWLDGSNDWIYRHLHKMTELMISAAGDYRNATGLERRLLNQMARELLIAQSSDWAFIMKSGTFPGYAVSRSREHIGRFLALHDQLRNGGTDTKLLEEAERKYNIFRDIDYNIYAE
jgi:1,4-alpha-glucan branching enzyme